MSACVRRFSSSDVPTIRPGPTVQGPAVKSMIRAPVAGADASRSASAAATAAPQHRSTRCPFSAPGWSPSASRMSWTTDSHSPADRRKRPTPDVAICGGPPAAAPALRPSMTLNSEASYVLFPSRQYALGLSTGVISCTVTCVPNVTRPTRHASGSIDSAC